MHVKNAMTPLAHMVNLRPLQADRQKMNMKCKMMETKRICTDQKCKPWVKWLTFEAYNQERPLDAINIPEAKTTINAASVTELLTCRHVEMKCGSVFPDGVSEFSFPVRSFRTFAEPIIMGVKKRKRIRQNMKRLGIEMVKGPRSTYRAGLLSVTDNSSNLNQLPVVVHARQVQ